MSKTWLITGSSRGFGRELARVALEDSDRVVATARRPEQLKDLVAEYGDHVRAFALDVTDRAAAREAVAFAVREFGGLDVVANNAGYANSAPIEDMAEGTFRGQVEANFSGVVTATGPARRVWPWPAAWPPGGPGGGFGPLRAVLVGRGPGRRVAGARCIPGAGS